jgi:hypothetical protein
LRHIVEPLGMLKQRQLVSITSAIAVHFADGRIACWHCSPASTADIGLDRAAFLAGFKSNVHLWRSSGALAELACTLVIARVLATPIPMREGRC